MKWFSKIGVLAAITSVIITSCTKTQCNEDIPAIEFSSFEQFDDNTAKLIITFKDCNGDIGLNQADSVDPYKYNLFMEYYEKQNGTWVNLAPLIPYYYRIPVLYDGSDNVIEGDVELTMASYYKPKQYSPYDTIKFSIHILDRGLNESNVVETEEIIKPDN
ncbi:MAG: hypothetical protein JKY42_08555 [Flavobacteriales bacterium]|nr:hypothetical protein [Flavobacteriales bacterium]